MQVITMPTLMLMVLPLTAAKVWPPMIAAITVNPVAVAALRSRIILMPKRLWLG